MEHDLDSRTDFTDELRRAYLFSELDDDQLAEVVREMRLIDLDKGERLFEQGDPARRFFVVRRGLIKLYRLSPEGHEKIIELIAPGQSFAEALMFMAANGYPVHAEAVETTELFSFDNEVYKALLRDSVESCFRLMASMSMRLHKQINEIDRLTLHNATYRLVAYLLQELPEEVVTSPDVQLTTAKSVIASRLSIQPETFSRILARLSRDGLIEVEGNRVLLRDIPALRRLIELPDSPG
ncbi:MAG: Crp/Fnr family transcriptional regulator [Gammaproteobacteria bacterium]